MGRSSNDTDHLRSLEQRGWAALSRGEGRSFFSEVFADDAVVLVPGAVLDKEQTLASWDGVTPWQWYDLIWRQTLDLGCVAMVIYDVVAQRRLELPYRATVCSTYARRPDGWRLVLHQQTPSI